MKIVITTSWDDGHPLDTKLAEVLTEFGIRGTFYVTPNNRELPVIRNSDLRVLSDNFEIGAHTLTHPNLRLLDERELKKEIYGSKIRLEDIVGRPVNMFCYPGGRYSAKVRRHVIESGFIGARTTRMIHVDVSRDYWLLPTTAYCNCYPTWIWFRHCLKTANWGGLLYLSHIGLAASWNEVACGLFDIILKRGGVWHLWGHSWEIEKLNLWDDLRMVLKTVSQRKGVMYLSNGELVQMLLGRK